MLVTETAQRPARLSPRKQGCPAAGVPPLCLAPLTGACSRRSGTLATTAQFTCIFQGTGHGSGGTITIQQVLCFQKACCSSPPDNLMGGKSPGVQQQNAGGQCHTAARQHQAAGVQHPTVSPSCLAPYITGASSMLGENWTLQYVNRWECTLQHALPTSNCELQCHHISASVSSH